MLPLDGMCSLLPFIIIFVYIMNIHLLRAIHDEAMMNGLMGSVDGPVDLSKDLFQRAKPRQSKRESFKEATGVANIRGHRAVNGG